MRSYRTPVLPVYSVRGRPTLKDVERFRNGSVREPYKKSQVMSEHLAQHTETCISGIPRQKTATG